MARITRNPFALMLNPEIVLAAIERSEHLGHFTRRICRPLDRPLLGDVTSAEREDADDESPTPAALN
ncbi:MAG: hypothetical protein MZW92_30340 [Comamonadaceae bacterium]|nr:hypothetical protein [Comamonadaceae bacterium]